MATDHGSSRDAIWLVVAGLSGAAGLGYEIVWARSLASTVGGEAMAVAATLAGFFAGLAIGARWIHGRLTGGAPLDAARTFAKLETVAATWAAASPLLFHALGASLSGWLGRDGGTPLAATTIVAGALLLPATACMGASFPALVAARRRASAAEDELDHGRMVGRLVAAQTFGAVAAVLGTTYLVLPALGLVGSAVSLAALGWVAAFVMWRRPDPSVAESVDTVPPLDTSRDSDAKILAEPGWLYAVVAATGALGIAVEFVGVRVLSQVMTGTVYTFANASAVYLLGTAGGAWAHQRWGTRLAQGRPALTIGVLLTSVAVVVSAEAAVLRASPELLGLEDLAGASLTTRTLRELWVCTAVFALPTALMGALYSHLFGLFARTSIGGAYALNSLASAAAPVIAFGWLIPRFGLTDAWFTISVAYLTLGLTWGWLRRFPTQLMATTVGAPLLTMFLARGSLVLVDPPEGWRVLSRVETAYGVVTVSEAPGGNARRLQVDRHFRMGGAVSIGERRMGHLPLLLHPEPRSALFLGLGTAATMGAATHHDLERIVGIELVPEVLDALRSFSSVNEAVFDDPRATLHAADARHWLAANAEQWDVIVADLFHPARDGAGRLYAREHFDNARDHLAPGGVFVQWLPLYQLDRDTAAIVVRTFVDAFPDAEGWLALYNVQTPALGLVGWRDGGTVVDVTSLRERLGGPHYVPLAMTDTADLLAGHIVDADGLRAFAGDAQPSTDLRPRATYAAARGSVGPLTGLENLEALLAVSSEFPAARIVPPEAVPRTRTFAEALRLYLQGEALTLRRAVQKTPGWSSRAAMAYLEAYEAEPDFLAVRPRLYAIVDADDALAGELLPRMLEATPNERRVHEAWLRFLSRTGDPRLTQALQDAQERFAPAPP